MICVWLCPYHGDYSKVLHRKFYGEHLEQSGEDHPLLLILCDDMSDCEKTSFIQFLVAESHKKDLQNLHLQETIDTQGERLSVMQLTLDKIESAQHVTVDENIKLNAQWVLQGQHLKKMQADSAANAKALAKALHELSQYRALYEVLRDEKFVGTSRKSGVMTTKATGMARKVMENMSLI